MAQEQTKTRVKFPIGAKLVIIISILLLVSLGIVISLVSYISTGDVRLTAEDNNLTINRRAGSQAANSFQSMQAAVLMYIRMAERLDINEGYDALLTADFFNFNRNIVAIETVSNVGSDFITNEALLRTTSINENTIRSYFSSVLPAAAEMSGTMALSNAAPFFQMAMICAVFSHQRNIGNETIKVLFRPDDLSETFGIGTNTNYLVNGAADVLLHPDNDFILEGANFSDNALIKEIQLSGTSFGQQITFTDNTGDRFFGAYYPIAGTDVTAITTIPHSVVLEMVRRTTLLNIFLTLAVLSLAILFIWFFSKTISGPVRSLAGTAMEIVGGNFDQDLKPKTNDEIGLLTESFGKMTGALNIFGRFTNKDIAVRAMRGEIKPGGLPKHATVFFSDIRGFTEKSENFTKVFGEDASDRIVLWLNEYFSHMIDCVEKTGGVVDKFIGDAVMAHWGTASTAGSPAADAFNGVKASLMMRNALYELNKTRKKNDPGSPEICIGAGLNTGIVTAGQLGSEQRMEYTVIGDPVNLASRTEALNKPLGTDILITEDTWNLVRDKFITEEMPAVTVKGKEKPVRMFAVINHVGADGPTTLAQVRTLLNITPPDLNKVDTNAEEKKYKIQGV